MITRLKTKSKKGYAFALFLSVLVIITSIIGWNFIATNNDIANAQNYKMKTEARAVGQDALSRFYSAFTAEAVAPQTENTFRRTVILGNYNNAVLRDLEQIPNDAFSARTCDPTTDACVRLSVNNQFQSEGFLNNGKLRPALYPAAQPQVVTVTAEVFGQCSNINDLSVSSCAMIGAYTQKLVPSQVYEYAFYNDYITLEKELYPAGSIADERCHERYASDRQNLRGCLEVSYQSELNAPLTETPAALARRDVVDGPIFTNDDYISVCNSPLFRGYVYANPSGVLNPNADGRFYKWSGDAGCVEPTTAAALRNALPKIFKGNATNEGGVVALPFSSDPVQSAKLPTPAQYAELLRVSLPSGQNAPQSGTNVVFTTNNTTGVTSYRVDNRAAQVVPTSGVLWFNNSIRVSGTYAGSISVYSQGKISIVGNLQRQTARQEESVLALVSASGLSVEQVAAQPTPPFDPNNPAAFGKLPAEASRRVDAVLISLEGSVSLSRNASEPADVLNRPEWTIPRWQTNQAPTLAFTGAIAAKHQGLFGGYDEANGSLNTGFRKAFTFDERLIEGKVAAPFLPSLITGNWSRVNFAEVPQGN